MKEAAIPFGPGEPGGYDALIFEDGVTKYAAKGGFCRWYGYYDNIEASAFHTTYLTYLIFETIEV